MSINTHIVTPLEHRLSDNSVNYTIVKHLNDKMRRVKTQNDHFSLRLVNVTPKITNLAQWKAKFSEIGNELIRHHASYISGLPLNRRENEKDSNPKGQSGSGGGGSGRSQSNKPLTNVKVISIKLNPARNPRHLSATGVVIMLVQLIRLTHATKKITHTRTLISQQSRGFSHR